MTRIPSSRSPISCRGSRRPPRRWTDFFQASLLLLTAPALAALPLTARAAEPMPEPSPGKLDRDVAGTLVLAGGGDLPDRIFDRILELAGGKTARLVVIPTASIKADQPEEVKDVRRWRAHEAASVVLLHTRDRAVANDPAFLRPLTTATAVWLCGGDQSRLVAAYRGTALEQELRRFLARGGVLGGTSAGTAVMSGVMITGGKEVAEVGSGFGFLPGVVVDQHFRNRNRQARLLGVLSHYPSCPGIGIDEQTAAVVHGHTLSVLGQASVSICLPAVAAQPARIQLMQDGDRLDLLELCRTAQPPTNAAR